MGASPAGDVVSANTTVTSNKSNNSSNNSNNSTTTVTIVLLYSLVVLALIQIFYKACLEAFNIRLYAVQEYGRIIHEFDPYFNYRATEYLWANGWKAFCQWFDYKVWYPLGRPVGTTIYPGMQVTAVLLKQYLIPSWSINDICVFIPAWFGVTATMAVAWLTYECTIATTGTTTSTILKDIPGVSQVYQYLLRPIAVWASNHIVKWTASDWGGIFLMDASTDNNKKKNNNKNPSVVKSPLFPLVSAVAAAGIMSIVPAHLLRSVAGGYDNESIAMTAMCLTFACWTFSLRSTESSSDTTTTTTNVLVRSAIKGAITGIAYFYMVAAWGGYVFVLNLIGVHAAVLILLGRYSNKLYAAYTAFYVVGTTLAIQVPVVGWTPLKSLEQLGPLGVCLGMQLLQICVYYESKLTSKKKDLKKIWKIRFTVFGTAALLAAIVAAALWPTGYFGPISARVRGLFVEHTKTGNPLVDSVAEHQPASTQAYFQYLHDVCYLAPVALLYICLMAWNDSSSFLLVYGVTAYYFSHRMVRLILLTAPIASCLGGIAIGRVLVWGIHAIVPIKSLSLWDLFFQEETGERTSEKTTETSVNSNGKNGSSKKTVLNPAKKSAKCESSAKTNEDVKPSSDAWYARLIRLGIVAYMVKFCVPNVKDFWRISHEMAQAISHPTIVQKAQLRATGETVIIDDYRDAYFWLKDNTPEDARIMAWWDYGYQITGIGDRTTLADGNTWNHEHIALLGRILTSPEKEAHRIARHLADYVLVWAGGGGDDMAKSPHLRRIANSVYRGLCREPTCRDFGFYNDGRPTPDMEGSLLYKLCSHGVRPDVQVDRNRFKEVFTSKYGKVRIYKVMSVSKESKEWAADPANRICDAPGSWFCRGQYMPALEKVLAEKRDFKQLEDFNYKGGGEDDEEYTRQYMENLKNPHDHNVAADSKIRIKKLTPEDIDAINEDWQNNEMTTLMWELISQDRITELKQAISENPGIPHIRSEDGRGPMWWAHEYNRPRIVKVLKRLGVSESRGDKDGLTPLDISNIK